MLPSLQAYLRKHALFVPGERVGVAVSGGADSVALLRALLAMRSELGIVLSVIHVHHGIRGAEADADEQFVQQLAQDFDLPLHVKAVDVPAHSKSERLSLETSARELRYESFRSLLESGACDKIATAHTLDDQAETVLLRILRGTGTRGLAAIPPLRDASRELAARIVRPLLGTRRAEIELYLHSLDQFWREDATNRDSRHLRNRVRHELLPQLEEAYNPGLRHALTNLAEIARAEEEHWASEVSRLAALVINDTEEGTSLDRTRFLAIPLALQRRLLVDFADRLDLPFGFDDIECMLHLAAHPGSQHEFEGGWTVAATRQTLEIRGSVEAPPTVAFDYPLPVPGAIDLPNQLSLRCTIVADPSRHAAPNLLAYERLQLPLRVRNWQPGDRFWPAGNKQAEKLKRLFQQRHVPAEARGAWPVVLSGSDIVWVRDFPVANAFKAQGGAAVLIEIG